MPGTPSALQLSVLPLCSPGARMCLAKSTMWEPPRGPRQGQAHGRGTGSTAGTWARPVSWGPTHPKNQVLRRALCSVLAADGQTPERPGKSRLPLGSALACSAVLTTGTSLEVRVYSLPFLCGCGTQLWEAGPQNSPSAHGLLWGRGSLHAPFPQHTLVSSES